MKYALSDVGVFVREAFLTALTNLRFSQEARGIRQNEIPKEVTERRAILANHSIFKN